MDTSLPESGDDPAAIALMGVLDREQACREESRGAERPIVLVGLMGAGKTTVGRRLASHLRIPFRDADHEIEAAARMPIVDIFSIYGEAAFRDVERRVIARLLGEGTIVLATGGGAYMNADTRATIARTGVSVWLKADHGTLMRRVRRRSNRPLLDTPDPEGALRRLLDEREPVYALADHVVESREGSPDQVVRAIVRVLRDGLQNDGHPGDEAAR